MNRKKEVYKQVKWTWNGVDDRRKCSNILYCGSRTRAGKGKIRVVWSGAGTGGEKLLCCVDVFGCGDARREATFFTVHQNKRRYSEYTRRVFGYEDARREVTFFTVHQKREKIL